MPSVAPQVAFLIFICFICFISIFKKRIKERWDKRNVKKYHIVEEQYHVELPDNDDELPVDTEFTAVELASDNDGEQ